MSAARDSILTRFESIRPDEEPRFGGKAFTLGILAQRGFPVPGGAVLDRLPQSESEWAEVESWWKGLGQPEIAARSSAVGEDSKEFSFAGQQVTHLNLKSFDEIRRAVVDCFASTRRQASLAYQSFAGKTGGTLKMNVVLQKMIAPRFSGVFFSRDPRGHVAGWILESVPGLGEALVSGSRTPERFHAGRFESSASEFAEWKPEFTAMVSESGIRVSASLGYEVDMEWAIDAEGKFWVLQARPITAVQTPDRDAAVLQDELSRLRSIHSSDVLWDGQTFSEWTGTPTDLTFDLWKTAFSSRGAFGIALRRVGYEGEWGTESLLERVFGRAYVNLRRLESSYFGPTPYRMVAKPRPHLEFDAKRINGDLILHMPKAVWAMTRVAWKLQTERKQMMAEARRALTTLRSYLQRPDRPEIYQDWGDPMLRAEYRAEARAFATEVLEWPLILVILIESTMQILLQALSRSQGHERAEKTLHRWMGLGLETVTLEMDRAFLDACTNPEKRPFFLARFGMRGPGELDLSKPRWSELGDRAFKSLTGAFERTVSPRPEAVENEIRSGFKKYQVPLLIQEWRILKELLELRESWKMEILRPYAHLRWMALELGRRMDLGDSVFWLEQDELLCGRLERDVLLQRAEVRKAQAKVFRKVALPMVLSLEDLNRVLEADDRPGSSKDVLQGEGISSGMVYGEVRVVRNPEDANPAEWPAHTVLVAEATDPGWTPLFLKASAVVVERGGALSHCAIVAREMGLPAVSGIMNCHRKLKDGENVWVDGTHGRITIS